MIAFTTIAAVTIVWIKFLASDFAPKTAYSDLSPSMVMKQWIGNYLPFEIPPLLAAILILYGISKRWWWAVPAFFVALALDALGTHAVATALEYISGQPQGGILGGSARDRWAYVGGRSLTTFCAFATASWLGVRPAFGNWRKRGGKAFRASAD